MVRLTSERRSFDYTRQDTADLVRLTGRLNPAWPLNVLCGSTSALNDADGSSSDVMITES